MVSENVLTFFFKGVIVVRGGVLCSESFIFVYPDDVVVVIVVHIVYLKSHDGTTHGSTR